MTTLSNHFRACWGLVQLTFFCEPTLLSAKGNTFALRNLFFLPKQTAGIMLFSVNVAQTESTEDMFLSQVDQNMVTNELTTQISSGYSERFFPIIARFSMLRLAFEPSRTARKCMIMLLAFLRATRLTQRTKMLTFLFMFLCGMRI